MPLPPIPDGFVLERGNTPAMPAGFQPEGQRSIPQFPVKPQAKTRTPFQQSMSELTDFLSQGAGKLSMRMAEAGVSGTEVPI